VLLIVRLAWYLVDATGSPALRKAAVLLPLAVAFFGAPPGEEILSVWLFFWAAFYGVGILSVGAFGATTRPRLMLLAGVAAALWLAIFTAVPGLLTDGFGIARTTAALAGSLLLIALVALLAPGGLAGRIIGLVGEASLTIFLTHTIFGAMVRVALGKLGLLTPGTLVIAATLAGLVLPVVLHLAVLAASARFGLPLARWFGFGGASRSHYVAVGVPRPTAPVPGPANA
jgi:peptidoglycan/LPS O-acetylase OafA/YrhL